MVMITQYAKQKKRHRCTGQTFGLCGRIALKQVYYQGWNRSPVQAGCMRQVLRAGALGRPRGMGWGKRVDPWLIHVIVGKNHYNTVK